MKLKSIEVANFKAFGKEFQTIPIKPITLVFGKNSAGKSSLIHSLLWLNHATSQGETDVFHPVLSGKAVNLGGFDQCLNRKSGNQRLKLAITLENEESEVESTSWSLTASTFRLVLSYARIQDGEAPALEGCVLYADGQPLLKSWVVNSKNLYIHSKVQWTHPSLKGMFPQDLINELQSVEKYGLYRLDCSGMMPRRIELDEIPALLLECKKDSLGDLFSLFAKNLPDQIAEIFLSFRSVIEGMQYLPPLREIPDRSIDLRNCELPGWRWLAKRPEGFYDRINGILKNLKIDHQVKMRSLIPADTVKESIIRTLAQAEAGSDWGALSYAVEKAREAWQAFDYSEHMQWLDRHPALFKKMSDYWYDIVRNPRNDFQSGYFDEHPEAGGELVPSWWIKEESERLAKTLVDDWGVEGAVAFGDEAARLFISEDQDVRNSIMNALAERGVEKDLLPGDGHLQLRLYEPECDVWVALQDVGVGTSQVLPIVIEAFAQQNKLIAIEQPELHLHPALQAELGDVFIESALGENQNTFLLETHSEHLLLRIMKRMRQTAEGKLPEGMPPVRPEDVALLFVSPGPEGSVVQDIGLNERGELIKAWPGGFFEEGFNEMFD